MKPQDHLRKAERICRSINKLDPDQDLELIVEGIFGSALHYIAWITNSEIGKHVEMHSGLPRFLDENGFSDLAASFRTIDLQRQRRWYGGKGDGEVSRKMISILEEIQKRVEIRRDGK